MKIVLAIGLAALVIVIGVGLWATEFTVYLGNDPTACNNCHVMDAVYEGWYHAAHQSWVTCVDCHTPHQPVLKYLYKAKSGMKHVTMFTLDQIPEPLRAAEDTQRIIQANCMRCHAETVSQIGDGVMDPESTGDHYCFDCHRNVAHGPRGITILPYQDKGLYEVRDTPPTYTTEEK
jgi:cytochrome c nitrite reductase small subunit